MVLPDHLQRRKEQQLARKRESVAPSAPSAAEASSSAAATARSDASKKEKKSKKKSEDFFGMVSCMNSLHDKPAPAKNVVENIATAWRPSSLPQPGTFAAAPREPAPAEGRSDAELERRGEATPARKLPETASRPTDEGNDVRKRLAAVPSPDESPHKWKAVGSSYSQGPVRAAPRRVSMLPISQSSQYSRYRLPQLPQAVAVGAAPGLQNLGNTCYLSAVLQALGSVKEFVAELQASESWAGSGPLFACTTSILKAMATSSGAAPLNPERLRRQIAGAAPSFDNSRQQDAHEFFLEFINQLHDEMLDLRTRSSEVESRVPEQQPPVPTQRYFDSVLAKQLRCDKCGNASNVQELFRDASVDFPENVARPAVQTFLENYFAAEAVDHTCERCGCREASLTKRIQKAPRTLVLHLKRFVPNMMRMRYEKRLDDVELPIKLDLSPFAGSPAPEAGLASGSSSAPGSAKVPPPSLAAQSLGGVARPLVRTSSRELPDSPQLLQQAKSVATQAASSRYIGEATRYGYELRAVICHQGESPHCGHYVTWARTDTGAWRLFDDSRVSDHPPEKVRDIGRSAYMLYYVRCD
eukprot:TRINITY_DN16900_c0_g1_i1.p1 TRINITY_DN16900_c0_g1~~TRINITY_DN16900_c0_g1_i1.p1  ORF type:complete len:584 (+),score=156.32 TRINITY_DN16900_c0_g1_i1:69-1820(+)